jgi:TolA-binding protein
VAYDEDLQRGIRDLEEILQRLDDRAKNEQWVKENAPPGAPSRIKDAIVGNFEQPKAAPPPQEPPAPTPEPEPEPLPAPLPEPVPPPALQAQPVKLPPVEIPALKQPAPVDFTAPLPVPAPEPAEPLVKAATPLPTDGPPPLPEIKDLPAFLQPKAEPLLPQPKPAPAPKPARKRFVINRTIIILFCTGLAAAGGAYQLFINSAAQRYARAGKLVQNARNSEAISAYSRIITLYPRSIEAAYSQYAIADIKALQGDPQTAIEYYEHYLVAAPDKDPKIASARFKIAGLKLKEDMLGDAEFLYQNAAIQASEYAGEATAQVAKIKAVNAGLADAKKLIAKAPDKAVEAYTAIAAEHPKYAPALAGLEEARKALAAYNARPVKKRVPAPTPALIKSRIKAALTKNLQPPAPAAAPKTQAEICAPVWAAEQVQGSLSADMMFTKVKNNCDDLRQRLDACKEARDAVMALQGVPPEARVQMEQEIDPDWTLAKQVEQDDRVRKNYETRHCAELLKSTHN